MKYPKVTFFKDKKGKWRWHMQAKNGLIICNPGESFSSRNKAEKNFNCVVDVIRNGWDEEIK